jgi:alpha,alpha-trehalase
MSKWVLKYEGFDPAHEGQREALCTLGNGYFATRGAAPESRADGTHYPGTYVAGCWNRLTDQVDGATVDNESMVNLPNWLPVTIAIDDGDWLDLERVEVLTHRQELDLRGGVLTRRLVILDPHERLTTLTQRRFVHMKRAHLAALACCTSGQASTGPCRTRAWTDTARWPDATSCRSLRDPPDPTPSC